MADSWVAMQTRTRTDTGAPLATTDGALVPCPRLVFLRDAEQPERPSSYHSLGELDEIRFRRGAAGAERVGRVLTLALPDAWASSDHGRLVRQEQGWLLDDPRSKNGTAVDGELARRRLLPEAALLEIGRSFFWFSQAGVHIAPSTHEAPGPTDWPLTTFSPELAHGFEVLARLAPTPISIVLCGETGTGKEVVAQTLHGRSRRAGEFVGVNCGALPSTLLEAELFGHRRGAFSGAIAERRGLVRSADKGTLFLDEIGELPAEAQTALLRVLQEREVLPVGDDRPVRVDVRVIAATLRDLEGAVRGGGFRADLFARLAGHVVQLPPLRERREDLGLLLGALLAQLAPERAVKFAPPALRALFSYAWPHNIRELEQALTVALALAPDVVELAHLPVALRAPPAASVPAPRDTSPRDAAPRDAAPAELDEGDRVLREELVALLSRHDGNVAAAADAVGKPRQQLYRWINRLSIDLSEVRRPSEGYRGEDAFQRGRRRTTAR